MAVLAVIGLLGFGVLNESEGQVAVGDAAPVAELEVLAADDSPESGDAASLDDFRGQWVLINTWASWCPPCEDEAPDLVKFQAEHGEEGSFTILGVQTQDGTEEGLEFVDDYGLNYPSIRDGSGDYASDLGATGPPENFLVDPDGKVAFIFRGPLDAAQLDAQILPLIGDGTDS